jgi:hypothetical protein
MSMNELPMAWTKHGVLGRLPMSMKDDTPQAEKKCASLGAHLVVWHNLCKLPAHIADVLQHRVALLPLAH